MRRPLSRVGTCAALALAALALSMMGAPRIAHADQARVALSYLPHDAAKACPDEATFRGLVSARLGYDPFASSASSGTRLAVSLQRRRDVVVGTLSLGADDGNPAAGRTMRAPVGECLELVTSMALAAAVAVDPEAVHAREAPPPRDPEPAPAPPPPSTAAPPVSPSPSPSSLDQPQREPSASSDRVRLRFDLGSTVAIGATPGASLGPRVRLAATRSSWSAGLEGAYLLPSSRESAAGNVSASLAYLGASPCLHPAVTRAVRLDACTVFNVGSWFSEATRVTRSRRESDPYVALGARLGATIMPWTSVGFAVDADVSVALTRARLLIDNQGQPVEVWRTAPVGVSGAVSLVVDVL